MTRRSLTSPWTLRLLVALALPGCNGGAGESGTETASSSVTATATTTATATATVTVGETAGESETGASSGSATEGSSTATTTAGTSTTGAMTDVSAATSDSTTTTTTTLETDTDTDTDTDTGTTGEPVDTCKATCDDMQNVGNCTMEAPPDAFEPDIQWVWDGPGGERESLVTPLVANLTDDNDDGEIDLCDIPDILVNVTQFPSPGHLYLLDGATGELHFMIPTAVTWSINPALGDIDGDGIPEIIAAVGNGPSMAIAFEHDGTIKWQNDTPVQHSQGGAISLADLDNDGDVEIIMDKVIIDHEGTTVVTLGENGVANHFTTVAADLDGDGDLEVVIGANAYHHDGAIYYQNPGIEAGFAQVANLDDDPQPEIIVNSYPGVSILEHTGAIKVQYAKPGGASSWFRPGTIHDFDGDMVSEIASSSSNTYVMFEGDLTVNWTAPVQDTSGWAAGTAFDFDGNGIAEAMYADEANLYVFDGTGTPLLSVPRSARTLAEYPVVADVDNDGSAEIVVVSDAGFGGNQTAPTVQVIRDIEDRWIQPRRIWNQHTYHVTNVCEGGQIPQFEDPWWEKLNTFRTNSQIEGGEICIPPQ